MLNKRILGVIMTSILLLDGCGSNTTSKSTEAINNIDEGTYPKGYPYKVINNKSDVVESKLEKLTIRLYSNVKNKADSKSLHKAVVVNINGNDSKTMPIQSTYLGNEIIVGIYDEEGKLIIYSDVVEITDDVPVILVNLDI